MMTVDRKVRKAQTIAPFGVGAIFDFKDESFIGMDVSRWPKNSGTVIECTRLSRRLGNAQLRSAPREGLPYMRFPRWLYCRRCNRMTLWSTPEGVWKDDGVPRCGHHGCGGSLIPMRFIMVCEGGHLSDVPWNRWVHMGSSPDNPDQSNCDGRELVFRAKKGSGGGLDSLYVECLKCRKKRTLDQLMRPDGLRGIRCTGGQPWYARANRVPDCREKLRVVQRGATNLYTADIMSAIDIPPESNYDPASTVAAEIRQDPSFGALQTQLTSPAGSDMLINGLIKVIASNQLTPEERRDEEKLRAMEKLVRAVASEPLAGAQAIATDEEENLLIGEWHALTVRSEREVHPRDRFQAEHTTLLQPDVAPAPGGSLEYLNRLIAQVVLVRRLREVRALTSFTRLGMGESVIPVGHPTLKPEFFPSLEVFGEGIFLSLNEEALKEWEKKYAGLIQPRVGILRRRLEGSNLADESVTSRFLILHTLAHLLIRQLAFEAGYSSSALRERIYAADPDPVTGAGAMAGLLIYTAAGDQEGTLGGLVRLGEPPYLAGTLLNALAAARWCSADPVCSESVGQGSLGLNLAACHACTLVSETSCTHRNLLLDRTFLLGEPSQQWGFFSEVLMTGLQDYLGAANATTSL